jgi:hypothetical protein
VLVVQRAASITSVIPQTYGASSLPLNFVRRTRRPRCGSSTSRFSERKERDVAAEGVHSGCEPPPRRSRFSRRSLSRGFTHRLVGCGRSCERKAQHPLLFQQRTRSRLRSHCSRYGRHEVALDALCDHANWLSMRSVSNAPPRQQSVRQEPHLAPHRFRVLLVVVTLGVTRIVVALVTALISRNVFGIVKPFNQRMSMEAMFLHGDSGWYLTIAQSGYKSPVRFAFYPLYPILVRSLTSSAGQTTAALVVSWAAFFVAIWGTIRVAQFYLDDRFSFFAGALLAFNPGSIFLLAAYPDSLIVALCAWSCVAILRGRYWTAALLVGLATAAIPTTATAAIAISLFYLRQHGLRLTSLVKAAALGLVGELGILAVGFYAWRTTGNFFEERWADSYWGIAFHSPIATFKLDWNSGWFNFHSGGVPFAYVWDAASTPIFGALVIVAAVLALRQSRYLPLSLFAILAAVQPLIYNSGYGDVGRMFWEYFAAFVIASVLIGKLPKSWQAPVAIFLLVLSAASAVALDGVFTTGRWLT